MKGQTQAVTAVLITGVILGSVTSAYIWGVPLVEKRQSQADVNSLESSITDTRDTIRSVANSGQGSSEEISLELNNGNIEINESGNYIDVTAVAGGASYPVNSWKILGGGSRQGLSIGAGQYGIQGQNTPGVAAAKRTSTNSIVQYRIEFRNMRTTTPTGPELRQIDLKVSGSPESSGDTELRFSNQGQESDTGSDGVQLSSGERIDRRRTVVEVDLR